MPQRNNTHQHRAYAFWYSPQTNVNVLYASYLAPIMADKSNFQQKLKISLNASNLSNFTSNPDFDFLGAFFQRNYTHSKHTAVLCFLALLVFHRFRSLTNYNVRDCFNALKFGSLYLLTVIITTDIIWTRLTRRPRCAEMEIWAKRQGIH
jgi:hypothetical protein